MKNNDYSFKIVAAVILAGVIVAFASPAHPARPSTSATASNSAITQASSVDTHATSDATE